MDQDTQKRADLHFSFELPAHMRDAAHYKAAGRGYDDNVLFESGRPFIYSKTLALITSVYMDTIKLVHFDGELLHIFMLRDFTKAKQSVMRRIFSTTNYNPDVCLADILRDNQAEFSVREQDGADLLVTSYVDVEPYEGKIDIKYLEPDVDSLGIPYDKICSVVLRVGSIVETRYENADSVEHYVGKSNGDLEPVNFYSLAQRNNTDVLFASREIAKVERYFQQTKFKAGNNARKKG